MDHARSFDLLQSPAVAPAWPEHFEAFPERDAKPYLIRDRDAIYGNQFRRRIPSLGINEDSSPHRGALGRTHSPSSRTADWLHSA